MDNTLLFAHSEFSCFLRLCKFICYSFFNKYNRICENSGYVVSKLVLEFVTRSWILTSLKYKPLYDFWTIIGDSDHTGIVQKKCLLIFFAMPYEIVDFQTITTTVLLQKVGKYLK